MHSDTVFFSVLLHSVMSAHGHVHFPPAVLMNVTFAQFIHISKGLWPAGDCRCLHRSSLNGPVPSTLGRS